MSPTSQLRLPPTGVQTVDSLVGSRVGRGVSAAPEHNSAVASGSGPPGQEECSMNTADVPDRLLLDYRLDSGVAVVKVTGEVDVSTSNSLRNSLLRVITDEVITV